VEISDAGFKNGLLVINLQVNTPEAELPKKINIG
jgi:HSP20 family molecular chaperone IbpA